jgi:ketosteroid isomerase-like protein
MSRFCWILIFDVETGKVVKIREYLNTVLVKEAVEGWGLGG